MVRLYYFFLFLWLFEAKPLLIIALQKLLINLRFSLFKLFKVEVDLTEGRFYFFHEVEPKVVNRFLFELINLSSLQSEFVSRFIAYVNHIAE